ncbi:MAG: VWA domain-containing protein [Chitinophagaceae bacterium]|nr:MAG: VWA domain-containing protein [Chitinophagaceae bacterium]
MRVRIKKNETNLLVKLQGTGVVKNEDLAVMEIKGAALSVDLPVLQGRVAGVAVTSAPYAYKKSRTVTMRSRNHEPGFPLHDREGYDAIKENGFRTVKQEPLSTFSIDVDAASYSNVRRMLNMGQLPPAGAVRIEEMINYFKYEYNEPENDDPFSINTEIAACPWNTKHKLVSVGLQGRIIPTESLPASNLVFLIDVSGSMSDPNKLPLVQQSLKMLVDQLREKDRVALVVYAGSAGLVLPSTKGDEKIRIKDAIDRLEAGGSTAGGAGIQLAYKTAREHFIKGGNNRIILCSDGDFNVGASSDDALETMIEKERKSGVFLTILGYGMGNYQDAKMQKLANKGNGNHAYIDGISEARKVLVKEFGGTLFAIAKDVKLQVEFNPAKVQAYRLVGYENRLLNNEDFNDDKKDAGELGSGHTVTALYEIIPVGVNSDFIKSVDPLKYQDGTRNDLEKSNGKVYSKTADDEMMTIKFRYKQPDGDDSRLITHPVIAAALPTSDNFRFAAAVAQFGMLLRNSAFKQQASYDNAWQLAKGAIGKDDEGYRAEFIRLLKNAQDIEKGMSAR